MRAPTRLLPCLVAILVVIAWPTQALAQEEPSAELRLLRQTAWTSPEEPLLVIELRVTNTGDVTIPDPFVRWELGPKIDARFEYEAALEDGPSFAAGAATTSLPADLGPGITTDVELTIDTAETGSIDPTDSGVYPLELELRTEDLSIASITTAAIHIARPPEQPVLFSWWTEVAAPVAFGPEGTMIDPGFADELAKNGSLVSQVDAIADLLRSPSSDLRVDLVVSPAALDQLRLAADGYAEPSGDEVPAEAPGPLAAAQALERLAVIAGDPRVRVHAMPFAAPRLPALLSGGLETHLEAQWRLGNDLFERILGQLPDPTVARPPGVAFDERSVEHLEARGATTILGAADSVVRPPQPNDFAPPPAATLTTSSGAQIGLVLPDPGTHALLEDTTLLEDPVRAAQVVLGQLAVIWREQPVPGDDVDRGLALDLPPGLPSTFWRPMIRRLVRAPFLDATHTEDLPDLIEPPPDQTELLPYDDAGFTSGYEDDLDATGRRLLAFASILEDPADDADRLRRDLLYAEASQYIENEGSGRAWINAVNDEIDATFEDLAPDTSRPLTFTSRSGTIPLTMGDPGDRVVNVQVQLRSGRVDFLGDDVRALRLVDPDQVVEFDAEFRATGPSTVEVFVLAPNGEVLSRQVLLVRSTAINSIALIITIGAGLLLVGLWSRRFFRRRSR